MAQLEALILEYAAGDTGGDHRPGQPFLLRAVPFCLRIRLVAPLETRIERIMGRERLDRAAAARLISRVDRDRACYIRANYGADWDLDQAYDLTLNTGSLAYDRVVEMLVEALAGKDRLASPEAKARLKDVALAHRLKARVATDPRVLVPTLEVNLEDGALVVSGIIHHPKELHLLQEIAREVCGERTVRFDLHHRV